MKISVALAYYNGGRYIEEQLDSILKQLKEKDELVISVDKAEDGSRGLLEKRAEEESRIRLVDGPGKGVVKNFEYAISQCEGDVIFLSDQDDIWVEGKVKKMLKAMKEQRAMAVLHDASLVDEKGELLDEPTLFALRKCGPGIVKNLIKNSYTGCCMAFRKELLPVILPIPDDMYMHDYWIGTAAEYCGRVAFLEDALLYYRRHGGNVTEMHRGSIPSMVKKRMGMLRGLRVLKLRARQLRNYHTSEITGKGEEK